MVVQYGNGKPGDRKRRGFRRYRAYQLHPKSLILHAHTASSTNSLLTYHDSSASSTGKCNA